MVRTGFGYEFNSLQSDEDELSVAFRSLVAGGSKSTVPSRWTIRSILMAFAPVILKLVRVPFFLAFLGLIVTSGNPALAIRWCQKASGRQKDHR